MKITVLGAGMVGSAIARDLAMEKDFKISIVDFSQSALENFKSESFIHGIHADLSEKGRARSLIANSEFVISAVPGYMGFNILREVIEAGKNVVDISFFNEDAFELDKLAKSNNVTAVVDCGVAPGLCNILAGYVFNLLDRTDSYVCYVGGLPLERKWPFEYKAPFSPVDVLEEYTRPSRLVEYGKVVIRPALSECELMDFERVGTLEAFNTDGLRSLIKTLQIPTMREKTLRYPGHANLMRVFRESGFLGVKPIEVDGQKIKPIALTSKLLFDQWRLGKEEAEFTVMQVRLDGLKDSKSVSYQYDLYDQYDAATKTSSMARTTGYTCSIIARQVINGLFTQKGICPPEYIGPTNGCYDNLMLEYKKRNIQLRETINITK